MKEFIVTKKELMHISGYKEKKFPKYTASLINLLNRWARGTADTVVGHMATLAQECPYKDYEKWKKWYFENHPNTIDEAVKLIMSKKNEVKDSFSKIDEKLVRDWVIDLVIDKSFWGLKIQEAVLLKIKELTGKKTRLANKAEESKGIDGFIENIPVQIKPTSYKTASSVKTEELRAKTIFYEKQPNGDYVIYLDDAL